MRRAAWILAGVTVVLVVADVVISAQSVALTSQTAVAVHGFPFVHGAVIGSALMGALIISRYDRHPIGWLLTLIGVSGATSLLAEAYAYWIQEAGGPGSSSAGAVSAWASAVLGGQLQIAGLALMFLLAPDGHLLSARWRYVAWGVVLGALLYLLAIVSRDPTEYILVSAEDGISPLRQVAISGGFLLISAGLVASVVSMVKRLRRSSGEQRRQLRLIALSVCLAAFGLVCLFGVQAVNGGNQTWLASLPLYVSYFLLPILFAVAVLRHRLYALDVIINRTAVLAAATVFAAVGYTTLVVVVSSLVGRRTGGFWLSLLVTALVAVAFQPLRRHVIRLANRVAYGSRAQPYEALADFSSRLVEAPSAERLLPAVAAAAGTALAAREATATLSVPDVGVTAHTWGTASSGTHTHTVAVVEEDSVLGSVEVAIPKGRRWRASDERLLQALADQAAVAFRNVAMQARLADHVAELDRTTEELARSRARIIEADDAIRRDLEDAISGQVLPHLLAVASGLGRIRASDGAPSGVSEASLERLIDQVSTALESLRELTRGVFPTQLTRSGLGPALRSLLAGSDTTPDLALDPALEGLRFAARVEAAVYFCCAQATAWAASIELALDGAELCLAVRGGRPAGTESPSVVDRVEATGGTLRVVDQGLSVRVPAAAAAQASESRSGPNVAFAT